MMKNRALPVVVAVSVALVTLTVAAIAWGHPGHHHHHDVGLWSGLLHPLTGLDHLVAALAVGAWAMVLGGSSKWQMPAVFLVAMVAGAGLAVTGLAVGGLHMMTAATVIALGVVIGVATKMPKPAALGLVALFGVIHGAPHAAGFAGGAMAVSLFVVGMLAATAALHAIGLVVAKRAISVQPLYAPRVAAVLLAVTGAALLIH